MKELMFPSYHVNASASQRLMQESFESMRNRGEKLLC